LLELEYCWIEQFSLKDSVVGAFAVKGGTLRKASFVANNYGKLIADAVNLSDATFSQYVSNAKFIACGLQGASFANATLDDLTFSHEVLEPQFAAKASACDLERASFVNAKLVNVTFDECELHEASFEQAELVTVSGLEFDANNQRNARYARTFTNHWLQLRREYSGARMVFNILLLLAFFVPLIARAGFWIGVNRLQSHELHLQSHEFGRMSLCLAARCEEWSVWELALRRNESLAAFTLAVALLAYNVLRLWLTWRVGPLREEEERSGHTPQRVDYNGLWIAHRIIRILFWLAITSLVWHAFQWLGITVSLPA
jgi:uncharacterized protein YjbI with pentapeptide repeats